MWAGGVDRRLFGLALEASAAVFLGEFRKELYGGLRRNFQLGRQLLDPTLTLRLATEDVRQFDADGDELDELETREAIGFVGVERVLPNGWELATGPRRARLGRARPSQSSPRRAWRCVRSAPAGCAGEVVRAEAAWTGMYQPCASRRRRSSPDSASCASRPDCGWGGARISRCRSPSPSAERTGFPDCTSASGAATGKPCSASCSPHRCKGRCSRGSSWPVGRTANGGALLGDDGWVGGVRAGLGRRRRSGRCDSSTAIAPRIAARCSSAWDDWF